MIRKNPAVCFKVTGKNAEQVKLFDKHSLTQFERSSGECIVQIRNTASEQSLYYFPGSF